MIFGWSEDNDRVEDVDAGTSTEPIPSRLTVAAGTCGIDSRACAVISGYSEDNDGAWNLDAGASTELMLSRFTAGSCGMD